MAERGGQVGNQNAVKNRPWKQALERALARIGGGFEAGLNSVADKVVAAAVDGDKDAWREIADRLDGKSVQMAEIKVTDDRAEELNDNDLNDIARRGRNGTAETQGGEKISSELH